MVERIKSDECPKSIDVIGGYHLKKQAINDHGVEKKLQVCRDRQRQGRRREDTKAASVI